MKNSDDSNSLTYRSYTQDRQAQTKSKLPQKGNTGQMLNSSGFNNTLEKTSFDWTENSKDLLLQAVLAIS